MIGRPHLASREDAMATKKKQVLKHGGPASGIVVQKDIKEVSSIPAEEAPGKSAKSEPKEPEAAPAIKVAVPSSEIMELETAKALVTCQKFVGLWITLLAGKSVTAPKEVIKVLREKGLVK